MQERNRPVERVINPDIGVADYDFKSRTVWSGTVHLGCDSNSNIPCICCIPGALGVPVGGGGGGGVGSGVSPGTAGVGDPAANLAKP